MELDWEQVVIDAHDPVALGSWWADVLGWEVLNDSAEEFEIGRGGNVRPTLTFLQVPEAKTSKNRLHLDFRPASDQAAAVQHMEAAGARRIDIGQGESDPTWVVLADPEGNEFCILRPSPTAG